MEGAGMRAEEASVASIRMANIISRLDEQDILGFLSKWWITVAVMGSLLMQLLLLLTGGTRKWSMASRFVAWNAYTWSDFIATSALGGLVQSAASNTHQEVYAIWAPILLLHLGAPDNISAYAMADAELWQRHGLNMLLQIAIVIYIVANCARGWEYVLLGICLTILGSIKYAERTLALKHASRADFIESALPLYKYMLAEEYLNLDIKGLNNSVSSSLSLPASRTLHPNPSYYYIIRGEKQWLQNFLKAGETNLIQGYRDAARATTELVTLQDVLSSEQLRQAAPSMVLLCAGYALFKMYKRRLFNLYMYEWRAGKTRELFMQRHVFEDVKEIMFVLDVELRFLFDSFYTKAAGTAFSKLGVSFRLLSTILLVVSGFIIFGSLNFHDQAIEQARNVTFSLVAAALIIEAYQLARLVLSDWSRVWLVCNFIIVGEKLKNGSSWSISRFLRGFWLSILLRFIKLSSLVGRHSYWRSSIGQYTMLDVDRLSVWRVMNKRLAKLIRQDCLQLIPEYVYRKQVVEKFKIYVVTETLASCRGIRTSQQTLHPAWFLQKYNDPQAQPALRAAVGVPDQPGQAFFTDLEHIIVSWHVATCVCEVLAAHPSMQLTYGVAEELQNAEIDHTSSYTSAHVGSSASPFHERADAREGATHYVDLQMSKLLSRYAMYLLVHKTELLPCHAVIARQAAADAQRNLCTLSRNTEFIMMLWIMSREQSNADRTPNMPILPSNVRNGIKAGCLLQGLPADLRWRLVAHVWVDILMGSASGNKPIEQLQQLTHGGEFLTHLWVLLGHMGYGSQ